MACILSTALACGEDVDRTHTEGAGAQGAAHGSGASVSSSSAADAASGGGAAGTGGGGGLGAGDGGSTLCGLAWNPPAKLFDDEIRIAAGTKLHAVGTNGGTVVHRSSDDQGAAWSDPVAIPSAGVLPIYGPLVADGPNVYLLTRAGGSLQIQRSSNDGATWSAPIELHGYSADNADRVQMDAEGSSLHVFVGRAGAIPDPSFKVYYWRSTDSGDTFDDGGVARILDDGATGPPSPGGIAVQDGLVHIGYAAITPIGTLGHRARYLRSLDNGVTWSTPSDVSGPGDNPQIRPRPRVDDGRVFILWEEPLDHDQTQPYPNATKSDIRMNVSFDFGDSWQGAYSVTQLPNDYENHPEVAVGPGGSFHVIYRLSADQATLTNDDPMGYRSSPDYGATWCPHEIAISDPTQETHPVNLVATDEFVHAASPNGVYARRPLK